LWQKSAQISAQGLIRGTMAFKQIHYTVLVPKPWFPLNKIGLQHVGAGADKHRSSEVNRIELNGNGFTNRSSVNRPYYIK